MASSLLLQLIFALATYQDLLNAKAELVIVDGSAYAGSARIVGDADQDAEMSEELINSSKYFVFISYNYSCDFCSDSGCTEPFRR